MKPPHWIIAGISFLIVIIAIRLQPQAVRSEEATEANPVDTGSAAVELCRTGLSLLASDNSSDATEMGGAMVQNAWALQSQYPAIVHKIWAMTKNWTASLSPDRRYLSLSLYLQSMNDAIDSCEKSDDLHRLWRIRQQITAEIRILERDRISALSVELAALVEEVEANGVEQTLLWPSDVSLPPELSKEDEEFRSQLQTLSDSSDEIPEGISDQLQFIEKALSSWIGNELESIKERYNIETQRDNNLERITPVEVDRDNPSAAKGKYAELLSDLDHVWKTRASPRVQFWAQLSQQATGKSTGDERLSTIRSEILRSIRIRYNIWAVRQINKAGTVMGARGCLLLGNIDKGHLDPSVSALYSSAEHDTFESFNKVPKQKAVHVQRMLLLKAVDLDAF